MNLQEKAAIVILVDALEPEYSTDDNEPDDIREFIATLTAGVERKAKHIRSMIGRQPMTADTLAYFVALAETTDDAAAFGRKFLSKNPE